MTLPATGSFNIVSDFMIGMLDCRQKKDAQSRIQLGKTVGV